MAKLTVEDLEVSNCRVLMRVDFNVPIEDGRVASDKRIRAVLPTIQYLQKQGAKLILISHLGRPGGERKPEFSLKPCQKVLSELLNSEVAFIDDCIGKKVADAVFQLKAKDILLLENLRFYKEETSNDPDFAGKLAGLGEVYVNEAFGTAHRAHASTEGITHYIKQCAAGYLMKKELSYLGMLIERSKRPFIAILGGAKISGKIDVISNLLPKVDRLLIGGGMAFTFFKALGYEIGNSLLETDKVALAAKLLTEAKDKLVLPLDCLVTEKVDFKTREVSQLNQVDVKKIPANYFGLDIGEKTIKAFNEILQNAKTVVWNGPMGVFEIPQTAKGTFAIADILAKITRNGAITVIGGGDSAAAAQKAKIADQISHISTGGGACLSYLEGKVLPGVAALTEKTGKLGI